MGLKESKLFEKIVSAISSALIPALIDLGAILLWIKKHGEVSPDQDFIAYITVIGVIASLFSYILVYGILPRFKVLRKLGHYEGRWLQIIPELTDRPCSIIELKFNQASLKYEMIGFNFTEDLKSGVEFEAFKFVNRTFNDGFYFITNHTEEHKNGLGKIAFIKSNRDNLTRAIGYFFDSSNNNCSVKYDTILIKCDKNFYKHLGDKFKYIKPNKITPLEIAEISQDLIKEEQKIYSLKKQQQTAHKGQCAHCPHNAP